MAPMQAANVDAATLQPPANDRQARLRRSAWLDRQLLPWRARQGRVLACTVAGGWLLVPQAAAIAAIAGAVLTGAAAPSDLGWMFAALALVLLLRVGLAGIGQHASIDVVEGVRPLLRARIAAAVHARGPLWLRRRHGGALAELSVGHVDAMEGYYAGYLPARTETAWVPVAILAAVMWADWIAGLVLLLTAPLIPVFMMLAGWGAEAAGRRQLGALARAGAHFADRLRGLDLIRAYGRADAELRGVAAAADDLRDRSMQVLRIAFLSSTVLEFFASVSVALIAMYFGFTYLGLIDLRGVELPLSTGLFCLLLAPEFHAPLRRLAAHYHDRANALAAVAEIESALEALPGEDSVAAQGEHAADRAPAPVAVRASRLGLRHAGAARPVLQEISFGLQRGQRLALVGPSGCGKSSLLEALAGWHRPEAGSLQIDPGLQIALAGQRPWLFHGSIADNIRLGDAGADDARVRAAAAAAQVTRFADALPEGLATVIGERGFGLSGGEARRVGLARALLRAPDLLLLDEPTAFLDPGTEAALLAALDAFAQGRCVVVATHSPALMAWAGRVLQLPEGAESAFPPAERGG
jgi:ATP-binding cassette, subfamily C, bacterial CydD